MIQWKEIDYLFFLLIPPFVCKIDIHVIYRGNTQSG